MRFDKTFDFHFKAVPMGRPRFSRKGNVYEPEDCEAYKTKLKLGMVGGMRGIKPLDEPTVIEIGYYFAMPAGLSEKKKIERFMTPCTNAKDLDNLDKAVLDAMKGIVLKDDHKVVCLKSHKMNTFFDFIEVRVRSWESFVLDPTLGGLSFACERETRAER